MLLLIIGYILCGMLGAYRFYTFIDKRFGMDDMGRVLTVYIFVLGYIGFVATEITLLIYKSAN